MLSRAHWSPPFKIRVTSYFTSSHLFLLISVFQVLNSVTYWALIWHPVSEFLTSRVIQDSVLLNGEYNKLTLNSYCYLFRLVNLLTFNRKPSFAAGGD